LDWLREPRKHFRVQIDGDLIGDGVRGLLIAGKLQVNPPTLSEHMRVLTAAGPVRARRVRQRTLYKRNEAAISAAERAIPEKA
jgi:DNA-binding transcriptional ArsR family regulator